MSEGKIQITKEFFLANWGKVRGCFTNTFVINSFIQSFSHPLVKISSRRRHALMVEDGALSPKIVPNVTQSIFNPLSCSGAQWIRDNVMINQSLHISWTSRLLVRYSWKIVFHGSYFFAQFGVQVFFCTILLARFLLECSSLY